MKQRVIHFVSGGGSGATRVALDVALAQHAGDAFEPMLVLRRKPGPLPVVMQEQIGASGLRTEWVDDSFPKGRTLAQLEALCRNYGVRVFVAHGYTEHVWGRVAAVRAGVRAVVHVEHNFERYLPWGLGRVRGLAGQTPLTIGVSSGVADRVRALGIGGRRVIVIHNGLDTARFGMAPPPLAERAPDIVMAARFARQKDHATLIRAVPHLIAGGWTGRLLLAGGGDNGHRRKCERLVARLGLSARVAFLGNVGDVPALLRACRVAVLSTRYEGLPLALIEAMACGCAAVASVAPGIGDVVRDGENGWLFPLGDAQGAARVITDALASNTSQPRADRGRHEALTYFSRERMVADYDRVLSELLAQSAS